MDFEKFVETIRSGIVAGVFTVSTTLEYMTENGWLTTRDVPKAARAKMLEDLTK